MKHGFSPIRLLAEVALLVFVCALLVMFIIPYLAPSLAKGDLFPYVVALLVVLISAPWLYWRCMAAERRGAQYVRRHTELGKHLSRMSGGGFRAGVAMTAAAHIVGLLLTTAGAVWLYQREVSTETDLFERRVNRLEIEVRRRFDVPLAGLKGLRATFLASSKVTREEFREYMDSRDLASEFPGIRGFGVIERVLRKDIDQFRAAQKADGAPDFEVKTSGSADDLYVIKYVEPLSTNKQAFGFDVGQEPVRRAAIELSLRSRQPTLTGRITLVQDGKKGPGFLFVLPVFRGGGGANETSLGVVYTPIVVEELMHGVDAVISADLDFSLSIPQYGGRAELLFDSDIASVAADRTPSFSATRSIAVGGQTLLLSVRSSEAYERELDHTAVVAVVVGGSLLSLLFALTVWLLAAGRMRAESLARRMTQDLDRLAKVVQSTHNAVSLMDSNYKITWVNEGFTRASGYTLDECVGRSLAELLWSSAHNVAMQVTLERGDAFHAEIRSRRKDGSEYWTDTEIQANRNDLGELTGFMEVSLDITEKRAATTTLHAALRENQSLLDTIHVHAIVSVTDADGVIVDVNDAFCKISGYRRDELLGKTHKILNSNVHGAAFWADMWGTISLGQAWRGEVCSRSKSGALYWVDSMIAPFTDADGKVERYISIRFDITEAKIAAEKLHENERFLAHVGRVSGVGGWKLELATMTLKWSEQTKKIHEVSPSYVPNLSEAIEFYKPEARSVIECVVREAIDAGMPWDVELPFETATGRSIWVRSVGEPEYDEEGINVLRLVGAFQDITERKKAELALSETASLLRAVLDAASEISVIATDPTLRITVFNVGAERLLGYGAGEVVGARDLSFVHSPDELDQRAGLLSAQRGVTILHSEALIEPSTLGRPSQWQFVRKDGSEVSVSVAITPMYSQLGKLLGYLSIAHDVTAQRRYEASLLDASIRAEQASVAKSQFLANMSHEIRTPMNAILGMLALLQHTALTPLQQDYARNTEGAARSLLGLLNDILDFSKVEAGKMSLDPRPFDIDRVMRDLSVILSANVGEKAVEVLFDIDSNIPHSLIGDDMRLQQVLINLGGNAIKFTAKGEVVITVRQLVQDADSVELEFAVRDSGIGIAPQHIEHIFSGFSQAESSTTRRFGGTGLGLAICQRLVGLMGGTLRVDSVLGEGSKFSFSLRLPLGPVLDALPAAEVAPDVASNLALALDASDAGRPMHVLIVDDNNVARNLMRGMAESLGWKVTLAESGVQALARLQHTEKQPFPYQAIFVDWRMPGMDGWETTRQIRNLPGGQSAPIVVMVTAHGREMLSQRPESEQALLNGFLVKPVTASMLAEAVSMRAASKQAAAGPTPAVNLRLNGIRLLVVEDNRVNQRVAQELLSREGAQISLANNGAEGVTAVLNASPLFDLVLMDVHMPVMDGYNATREIRKTYDASTLPIVAMTANAMSADRQACLDVGMNDHVGKPFDLNQLVATICRYVERKNAVAALAQAAAAVQPVGERISGAQAFVSPPVDAPAAAPVTSSAPSTVAIDSALDEVLQNYARDHGIEADAAISRLGGSLELYGETLLSLLEEFDGLTDRLSTMLSEGNGEEAERLLHTVKGISATLGVSKVADVAAMAELSVKKGELDAAGSAILFEALKAAIEQAIEPVKYLAQGIQGNKPENTGDAHLNDDEVKQEILADLNRLQAFLNDSDMAAMDAYRSLQGRRDVASVDGFRSLEMAMSCLDFDGAKAAVATMYIVLTK